MSSPSRASLNTFEYFGLRQVGAQRGARKPGLVGCRRVGIVVGTQDYLETGLLESQAQSAGTAEQIDGKRRGFALEAILQVLQRAGIRVWRKLESRSADGG